MGDPNQCGRTARTASANVTPLPPVPGRQRGSGLVADLHHLDRAVLRRQRDLAGGKA